MMTDNLINYLEPEDVAGLDTEDVLDVRLAKKVDSFYEDFAQEGEPGEVRDFYRDLSAMLDKYKNLLVGKETLPIFLKTKFKMAWLAFPALEPKERMQLMSEEVAAAAKEGVNIQDCVNRYLSLLEVGFAPEKSIRAEFAEALTRNSELIGPEPIILRSGDRATNSIANWLRDFVSYSEATSVGGGSYSLTQYLYASPNVKKLSVPDKEALSQVLGLYAFLKSSKIAGTERELRKIPTADTIKSSSPLVPSNAPTTQVVAAANPRGASLDLLRSRIEKQASAPVASKPAASGPQMTPEEFKREVETAELPPYREVQNLPQAPRPAEPVLKPKPMAAKVETINFAPKPGSIPFGKPLQVPAVPKPVIRPVAPAPTVPSAPVLKPAAKPAMSITVVDDLKKLNLDYLRAGSLQSQVNALRSQIMHLSEANNMLPYHVVLAFEESPLFKAYLTQGSAKIGGQANASSGLTQQEFEALADLRKEIESL